MQWKPGTAGSGKWCTTGRRLNDDEAESSEENLRVLKTVAKSQFTNARRGILSKIAHSQHVSSAKLDALTEMHQHQTSVIGDLLSLFASTVDKQEVKERRKPIAELEKLEELYSDATEKAARVLYSTQQQQEPPPMDTCPGLHDGAGFSPLPLASSDSTVSGSSSIGSSSSSSSSSSMMTDKRVLDGSSPGNANPVSVSSVESAVSAGTPGARVVQFSQHASISGARTTPLLTAARSLRPAARSFVPGYRDSGINNFTSCFRRFAKSPEPPRCQIVVVACFSKTNRAPGVSFHRFPKDDDLATHWGVSIRRENLSPDFRCTSYVFVRCIFAKTTSRSRGTCHLRAELMSSPSRKTLIHRAVPSIFADREPQAKRKFNRLKLSTQDEVRAMQLSKYSWV